MGKINLLIRFIQFFSLFVCLISEIDIQAAVNNNPFAIENNKKLYQYMQESIKAVQSVDSVYLEIVAVDEKEKENIYQYLREQLKEPMPLWELILLDYPQLRLLRNEIYARYGYIFNSKDLETYFRTFDWYKPDKKYNESMLSKVERESVALMLRLEYLKYNKHLLLPRGKYAFLSAKEAILKSGIIKVQGKEEFYFVEESNFFIEISDDGAGGSTWGDSRILDHKGKTLWSCSYSYEGGGGSIEYFMPNWGSNLIALIYGNLSEGKRAGMMESDTNNRICIFGKGGELVSDIKIDLQKNFPAEIDQIVLLSPDVLYVGGKESKAIVFVKKDLSFTPKIDNMYQWKSFEYSGKDLNGGCSNLNRKISIAPIFNPKLLWAKTIKKYNSNGSPIITKDAIVFVVSDRSDRVYPEQYATVIALDKLTGQEKWRYKTSEVVYSYDYFKNIFVLRGQKKLLLLDLLNGNLISEKNDILDGVPSLALRGELIIVGLYNHDRKEYTVDIFNSDKSQKIKSFNLLKMFSSDKEAKYRKIDNLYHGCFEILPNPIFYIVIEEGNAGQVKRKLVIISIGNDGDITWSYEKQLQNKYWESIPIKPLFVQVGNCNIHVVDGESVVILDPVEGKIIYEGSMKISPDMARVAQSGFAWGAYELKSAYASGKVYIDYKDKRIAQVRELACCKSYLDNYAYVDEFYPFQCVCLSKSCKENINQGEYYLEKIWWYAPTERGFERGPKIIYADNHFMIVKEDKRFFNDEVRFWAIGEEALYDSLKRQGSCNGQQTILDS